MNRRDEVHSACLNILTDSPHDAVRIAELCTFARALGGEIDDLRAACAAGPWRTDVENAPAGVWVSGWYGEDWKKVKRVYGFHAPPYWLDATGRKVDPPDAFAVPNPPQVTT